MRIVITGAKGQLGREWTSFLQRNTNVEIHAFGSSDLDITNGVEVKQRLKELNPKILVNCAAFTDVDGAEKKREKADLINHRAVKELAEIALDLNIKLVHFSTDYIFPGLAEDHKHLPFGYPEDHQKDPVNWYGNTKWEGEKAIYTSGCSHLVIRLSWLCGQYGHNFVKTMLRLADQKKEISVVGDQLGSPTFTEDVVKNSWQLIKQKLTGTYHITSAGTLSWADFAEAIFDALNKEVSVQRITSDEYPAEAARPAFSKLDTRKIQQVEGVQIADWRVSLNKTLQQLQH